MGEKVIIKSPPDAPKVYLRIGKWVPGVGNVVIDLTREEVVKMYLNIGEYLLKHSVEAKAS